MSFFSGGKRRALGLALLALHALPGAAPAQQHLFKLATLVPDNSSFVKTLRAIDAEVRRQTEGAVGFKLYPGGVQGDERVVLRKIRVHQLHGGIFGGGGLSDIFPDVLAVEVPFLFDQYEEIDYVMDQMEEFFRQGFAAHGYTFLGWADIGFIYLLSKQPVRGSADIKGLKVWRLEDEPLTEVIFRRAGVTSVPLTIPDVLLGLQTNLIDVVYASPAVAIVLQWFTRVKYLTRLPINYALGALLIDRRAFELLSPRQREILRQVSLERMREYNLKSRSENDEALQVMQEQGVKLVIPPAEEVESFKALVRDSLPELVGKAFSREAFEQVQKHLAEFRHRPQKK